MAKRRPSGDGMVRKREDGRWEGRIVVCRPSNFGPQKTKKRVAFFTKVWYLL